MPSSTAPSWNTSAQWKYVNASRRDQTLTLEQLKKEIFGRWADESWHEVLCLLAGMIAPRFVAQILEYLLEQPDPQQTCHAIFLAAGCVGEVRKRNELAAIEPRVLEHVKVLVRFNFDYDFWDKDGQRVAAVRIRAVSIVAIICRDAHDTLAWLKALAQSNEDWAVRRAAVREVARGWKEDPDTLPWLRARAQSDMDSDVRQAAGEELARGSKKNPQIETSDRGALQATLVTIMTIIVISA